MRKSTGLIHSFILDAFEFSRFVLMVHPWRLSAHQNQNLSDSCQNTGTSIAES
jgi:hypothetical protein